MLFSTVIQKIRFHHILEEMNRPSNEREHDLYACTKYTKYDTEKGMSFNHSFVTCGNY